MSMPNDLDGVERNTVGPFSRMPTTCNQGGQAGFLHSDDREQQTDDVQTDDQEVHQGGALQQG